MTEIRFFGKFFFKMGYITYILVDQKQGSRLKWIISHTTFFVTFLRNQNYNKSKYLGNLGVATLARILNTKYLIDPLSNVGQGLEGDFLQL